MNRWRSYIFDPAIPFEEKALEVFRFQYDHCAVYRRFCDALTKSPDLVEAVQSIPLLPIKAFKEAEVQSFPTDESPDLVFKSSGTGSMSRSRSRHVVFDQEIYRQSILKGFEQHYDLSQLAILAYLPGYSDNSDSSLIWMVNELIRETNTKLSRFLPLQQPLDRQLIDKIAASDRRLMLFGAAFGLLDLLDMESSKTYLTPDSLIIETGGMKTHRREMTRKELHHTLSDAFNTAPEQIHSEYGMAEMLSQAYQTGGEWFEPVPWLDISVRDPKDPFANVPDNQEGLIGILDLANIYSCSFLLTGDRGIKTSDGTFNVLGRWNRNNMRGCNFLIDTD